MGGIAVIDNMDAFFRLAQVGEFVFDIDPADRTDGLSGIGCDFAIDISQEGSLRGIYRPDDRIGFGDLIFKAAGKQEQEAAPRQAAKCIGNIFSHRNSLLLLTSNLKIPLHRASKMNLTMGFLLLQRIIYDSYGNNSTDKDTGNGLIPGYWGRHAHQWLGQAGPGSSGKEIWTGPGGVERPSPDDLRYLLIRQDKPW